MGKNIILKTLLSFMVLFMPLSTSSQILQSVGVVKSQGGDKAKSVSVQKRSNQKKLAGNTPKKVRGAVAPKSVEDTIYCTRTKKQHGWFMPLDTISKEIASHRNTSFRFTKKYLSGYWGKMEVVDGYGRFATSNMEPYILKLNAADTDKSANQDWVEKLKTSCIYEFIADPTEKVIIQERAYDHDMNLIYTYSRVPIGKGVYIGSYKDAKGLPAEMRKDPSFSYGTLVRLTEGKWGNDSIVEYIDSKGKAKPNSDDVAMSVYVYDKFGHLLKQQSRDARGKLVIDNWGNCGVDYVWDKEQQIATATFMDASWLPMKMPATRADNTREHVGIMRVAYKYDKYYRQIEATNLTDQNVADVNEAGIHKVCLEYNDRGDCVKQMNIGLNGELVEDALGMALAEHKFSREGKILGYVVLGKDKQLRKNHDYLSKCIKKYDEFGNQEMVEQYTVLDGKEHLAYKEVNKKSVICYQWEDGTSRVDSMDVKGRILSETYRDSLGNLSDKDNNYAIHQYKFVDSPKKTVITEYYLNKNRVLCDPNNSYARCIIVADTVSAGKYTKFYRYYDVKGNLINTYIQEYDESLPYESHLVGQYDTNAFGVVCRAGGSGGAQIYKCDVTYDVSDNKFSTFVGRDEFGEPDYITSSSLTYYYSKMNPNGGDLYLDENSQIISDFQKFKDECPKVMSIEVVDSMAYQLGLRDNDVILVDGSYANDVFALDSLGQTLDKVKANWTLHSVLDGSKTRSMIVFRVNPKTLKYGLVKIDGLKGTPSELGYIVHIRYLTQKQLKRIQHCVENNMTTERPMLKRENFKSTDYSGNHYVLLGFADLYRDVRTSLYSKLVTDPTVLLGVCSGEYNKKWTSDNGNNTDELAEILSSRRQVRSAYPRIDYFLSKNGCSITHLTLDERIAYFNIFDTRVSDECYAQLRDLYLAAKDSVDLILKKRKAIPVKNFVGIWKTKNTRKYAPEAHLEFKKDKTVQGTITNYGQIQFTDGTFDFKITQTIKGRWDNGEHWLFYNVLQSDTTLCCVDVLDVDNKQQKKQILSAAKEWSKKNANFYLSKMTYPYGQLSNSWYITECLKQELIVVLDDKNSLVFERTKDNLKAETNHDDSVSDASPLMGYWKFEVPDMPRSMGEFYFNENGEFNINFMIRMDNSNATIPHTVCLDMDFKGKWQPTKGGVLLSVSPGLEADVNIETDSSDRGAKENLEKEVRNLWKQNIKETMNEFVNNQKFFHEEVDFDVIDSTHIDFGGEILTKMPAKKATVVGNVMDQGYLAKLGLSGRYVVLQWCNWNCTQSIDEFSVEFAKQKENEKYLVLLPVDINFNKDGFKKVIGLYCPKDFLGIELIDWNIDYDYFRKQVLPRYKQFKRNKEFNNE